jgi:hypothetical protein
MQTEASCTDEKAKPENVKSEVAKEDNTTTNVIRFHKIMPKDSSMSVIRLPAYNEVRSDAILYAHTSRILHLETNPGNALALV